MNGAIVLQVWDACLKYDGYNSVSETWYLLLLSVTCLLPVCYLLHLPSIGHVL